MPGADSSIVFAGAAFAHAVSPESSNITDLFPKAIAVPASRQIHLQVMATARYK